MKKAVHFGAGNIGRGFIAPVLIENDFQVIFVDVDKNLVDHINTKKKYKIKNFDNIDGTFLEIENISAENFKNTNNLDKLLREANFISTSVGPQYIQNVYEVINKIDYSHEVLFIGFENMYRASTTTKNKFITQNSKITPLDAVVDKIIPPQDNASLDVVVESFGSIILEDRKLKPLKESNVVAYGDYEDEFLKKLWLLNGLHLQLSYFGISNGLNYIHEIYSSNTLRYFPHIASRELSNAFNIFTKNKYKVSSYVEDIHKRFSSPEIKDELTRVARNPQIKFSKNERFEKPLKILIENKKEIDSFKTIFNLISENDYSNIDGFREFRYNFENGPEEFFKNYWAINEKKLKLYIERLK